MNKKVLSVFVSWFLIFTIVWMFSLIQFLNWYFQYADSTQDINITIDWEEPWESWTAQLSVLDKQLEKQYKALSRKLWWKYYFNNSSNDTMLIKKTYYLDWQIVTAKVVKTNKKDPLIWDFKFDKLVEWKKFIESVTITAINWEKVFWELTFKWSELWSFKSWFNVLTTE